MDLYTYSKPQYPKLPIVNAFKNDHRISQIGNCFHIFLKVKLNFESLPRTATSIIKVIPLITYLIPVFPPQSIKPLKTETPAMKFQTGIPDLECNT